MCYTFPDITVVSLYIEEVKFPTLSRTSKHGRFAIPSSIPRGGTRADLGLVGKVRLTSDMLEHEILEEIRSAFAEPMSNNPNFQFVFLQTSGAGSNTLTIPSVSASYRTSKELVKMAGQGCLYIKAEVAERNTW